MEAPATHETSQGRGRRAPNARPAGTLRKPLVPWAAALLPLVGFLVLVDFAIWTDALRTVIPGLGRDDAPLGLFVVVTSGLIGSALLLGTIAYGETYTATLLITVPIVPTILAVAVLLIYLATDPGSVLQGHALYLGASAALAAWVLGTPLMSWLAVVDTAQGRSHGELVFRTKNLRRRVEALEPLEPLEPPFPGRASAIGQVRTYVTELEQELGLEGDPPAGLRFAFGTGYINLWREVHRAEELLIELEPEVNAVAGAAYDDLRISRSGIPNRDEIGKRLTAALGLFGPAAASAVGAAGPDANRFVTGSAEAKQVARAVLREVRQSIDTYRDDQWEGLIRERNRLLRTVFITSAATAAFVLLGVIYHVGREPFAAASAFYLVGATVGLFVRLRLEGRAEAAVDDYGLFEARLLHTPLLSGLAGVAGVFIFAVAPSIFGTNAAANQAAAVSLSQVFDLLNNTRGLIAAAIFGLTPELLTNWLGSQADGIKGKLEATRAAGAKKRRDEDCGSAGSNGSAAHTGAGAHSATAESGAPDQGKAGKS